MKSLLLLIRKKILGLRYRCNNWVFNYFIKSQFGYCDKTAKIYPNNLYMSCNKLFFYERTSVLGDSKFIISPHGENGKFIMKKYSGAAQGLTVVTGNHSTEPDPKKWMRDELDNRIGDNEHDVIVEEEVWIGSNVTLLPGVVVGRGSIIGAGSVLRKSVPPYSIVLGNPAKIIGFKYTPDQVDLHEKTLYPENERNDLTTTQKNYSKYFISRIKEIKDFCK